jgi:hypothetical protein
MLLLRLLETGVPFYLIVTGLVAEAVAGVSRRRPAAAPAMRAMGCGLLATMDLVFAGLIVFVVPAVLPSDDYTGSIRVRSFAWPEAPAVIRRTLLTRLHPIRQFGTMTVLERGSDPEDLALGEIQRRMTLRQSRPEDRAALEARTRERTDEPLPWRLLGRVLAAEGQRVAGPERWSKRRGSTRSIPRPSRKPRCFASRRDSSRWRPKTSVRPSRSENVPSRDGCSIG